MDKHKLSSIVYTQMWEYFSTYGMTALLVIFLIQTHGLSDKHAYLIFGSYMALLHSSPLIAAYFTSRKFSHEYAVISGGALMAIGHFTIALPSLVSVYISLSLMISGYGLFTPSLIALTGNTRNNRSTESKFTLFYVGQNIGSFLAPIACGFVGVKFGWGYGFILGGIGMLTGLIVFCRQLSADKSKILDKKLLSLMNYILLSVLTSFVILTCNIISSLLIVSTCVALVFLAKMYVKLDAQEKSNLLYILLLMVFMMVFFTMLTQGGTSIILFIERIVNKQVLGFSIPGPSILSIESLLMILISPIFFAKRQNLISGLSAINKYIVGLLLMAFAFLIFKNAAFYAVNTAQQCSILFVAAAFFLFATAELLIMPIGYAELSKYTHKSNLGFLLAIWGLMQAIARYLSQLFASLAEVNNYESTSLPDMALTYGTAFFKYSQILFIACGCLILIKFLTKLFVGNKEESLIKE